MDPVSVLAGVATGIKGCITLFNICVGLYDLIDRGSSYGKTHWHLMTKLDVEKFRLLACGDALRLVASDPGAGESPNEERASSMPPDVLNLITRIFCCMKDVFDDTKQLNKRYGLREEKYRILQSGSSTRILGSTSTTAFEATFQRFQARINKTQTSAGIVSKTRWAVYDGDKFKALVEKLHEWNDDLDNVLKAIERTAARQRFMENEFHLMDNTDDLRTIEEVAAEGNSTISDAASSRLRLLEEAPVLENIASGQSISDASFWTAPSNNLNSPTEPLSSKEIVESSSHQRLLAPLYDQQEFRSQALDIVNYDQSSHQIEVGGEFGRKNPDRSMKEPAGLPQLTSYACKRMLGERKGFSRGWPDFVSAEFIHDRIDELLGTIKGQTGTPYEGGNFFVHISIPQTYPLVPPVCVFLTKLYHPNINAQGKICTDILSDNWSPILSIRTVLISLHQLLSDPYVKDPLVPEIAVQYLQDRAIYERNARSYTQRFASQERPTDDEIEIARQKNELVLFAMYKEQEERDKARSEWMGRSSPHLEDEENTGEV